MFKKILFSLVVLVAIAVVVIAARPSAFAVERSAEIEAPADVVFGLVNDLHNWPSWSPWDKLDPDQTRTFEGAEAGKGATFSWKGNDKVGEGRMTIDDSRVNEHVALTLEFLKPWKSTNKVTFALAGGEKTKIVWRMEGAYDFFGKAMSLFMDMDSMVGKDFEAGLASLGQFAKVAAEKRASEEKARLQAEEAAAAAAAQEAAAAEEVAGAHE